MREYNVFLCPKCQHFEYQGLAERKLACKEGKATKTIKERGDSLTDPPPICSLFVLRAKK